MTGRTSRILKRKKKNGNWFEFRDEESGGIAQLRKMEWERILKVK